MSLLKRISGTSSLSTPANGQRPTGGAPNNRIAPGARDQEDATSADLMARVQDQLIAELDPKLNLSDTARVRRQVEEVFNRLLDSESVVLSRSERARMFEAIAANIMGFGPLEPLLNDPEVSEIMVNGPRQIYVERKGRLIKRTLGLRMMSMC